MPELPEVETFVRALREPLIGREAVLPVPTDVRHWFASPRAAVGFLLHAATLDTSGLGGRRTLSLPGLSATVAEEIEALRVKVTPSVGNFLLIHFPKEAGKTAKDADTFMSGRGLILRRVDAYGLSDALRLTIGSEEANRLVVSALRDFLKVT